MPRLQPALPKVITPKEAGQILKVTPQKITELIRAGEIPAIRVGARWRIRVDAFERYLRNPS